MDAMIDIETLGTEADAVVLSVGAVLFTEEGPASLDHNRLHVRLNIDEQLIMGRSVTASTMKWWFEQSEEARKSVWSTDCVNTSQLWSKLQTFLTGVDRVWARGTHFDLTILQHLFKGVQLPAPWKYNAPRDSRTILDLLPADRMPTRTNTAHNALDDAVYEAECVATAMRYIDTLKAWSPEPQSASSAA